MLEWRIRVAMTSGRCAGALRSPLSDFYNNNYDWRFLNEPLFLRIAMSFLFLQFIKAFFRFVAAMNGHDCARDGCTIT